MKLFNLKNSGLMRYVGERKSKLAVSGLSIQADWYIALVFAMIVFIALITSSLNLYNDIDKQLAALDEERAAGPLSINEERMRTVLDDLLERRHISSGYAAPTTEEVAPETATSTETSAAPDESVDEVPLEPIDGD